MTDLITRCPKCKTSFRVNEAHIKTARGAVRCGSCLNIFNAQENITNTSPHQSAQDTPIKDSDDDLLISDDMPDGDDESSQATDELSMNENVFIAKSATKSEINLFERRIKDAEEHEKDHAEADESWALSLLNESDEEEEAAHKEEAKEGHSNGEEIEHSEARDDFSSVFQVLEDPEYQDSERGLEPFPEDLLNSLDEHVDDTHDHFETEANNDFKNDDFDNNNVESSNFENNEHGFSSGGDFYESFEPEPLEIHVKNHQKFWQSTYFWVALNSFALIAIVSQVAYFKFEEWGRQSGFRPYYAQVCKLTGCELPVLQDLNRIKIENMVVIDHPKAQEKLLVDATLLNRAKFDQYFPTLLLTFSNLNNEIVSQYTFLPKQYVGGELAGKELMPARHPIHITLEIKDPGIDALNYQISIVKP